jgi:SAM-dependent methyltransferase
MLLRTRLGTWLWWRSHGREDELGFWSAWFDQHGASWQADYARRVQPAPPIEDPLVTEWLDRLERDTVRIIDVGAGPLTKLGVHYRGKNVSVVPVDPLARHYDRLLRAHGIEPAVRTIEADGERLLRQFPRQSFDIAYAVNSVDHSYDPLLVISNMTELVARDGAVLLRHTRNEGERRGYSGPHQWNFDAVDGDLRVWNHAGERRLSEVLGDDASVEAWVDEGQVLVRVRPSVSQARPS